MKVALLVEDLADVRRSQLRLLRDRCGLTEVYEADDLPAARRLLAAHANIDLALVNLGLPSGSGIDLIREIARDAPSAQCVVSTIYDDDAHIFDALAAGAHGYLLKDLTDDEWVGHLRRLEAGAPALSPSIARRVLEHFRMPAPPAVALTPRETDVLRYIGRGLRVPEVADLLGLAETTVAGYVKDVYRKLSVSSRAEAALEAARRGLV